MSLPTYDQFIEPILRFLASRPDGAPAREAHEAAAHALQLSNTQRQETIASGQATYKNRAGWAHDRLKRSGLSSSAKRGIWKLTEAGLAFAQAHPAPLAAEQVEHLAVDFMDVKLKTASDAVALDAEPDTPAATCAATASPEERLEQALRELRASVAATCSTACCRSARRASRS